MQDADRERIISDDYFDLIIEYKANPQIIEMLDGDYTVRIIDEYFAVLHFPLAQLPRLEQSILYSQLPLLFGLTDEASLNASGVFNVRRTVAFNLRGEGVIIGIIDTGIDFTQSDFESRTEPQRYYPSGTNRSTPVLHRRMRASARYIFPIR